MPARRDAAVSIGTWDAGVANPPGVRRLAAHRRLFQPWRDVPQVGRTRAARSSVEIGKLLIWCQVAEQITDPQGRVAGRGFQEGRRMTTKTGTYPLRLPLSLKAAVEKLAKQDGTSVNQFVVVAVAEKLSAMATAEEFAQRRTRADMDAFDRILNRDGGEPPRPDDVV